MNSVGPTGADGGLPVRTSSVLRAPLVAAMAVFKVHTECVNSSVSRRFGKRFLWKFLFHFSCCMAAQQLEYGSPA